MIPAEHEVFERGWTAADAVLRELRAQVSKPPACGDRRFRRSSAGSGSGSSSTAWSASASVARRSVTTCSVARRPTPATSEILHKYGTAEQKARYLEPLAKGEIRSCFSMTEPENPGSNPTLMSCQAVKHGDDYVIDGHKWFTSSADGAAFAIVMAVTNPEAPPHGRASMIIVPTDSPGFERVRNIKIMGDAGDGWASHAEIWYRNVHVPIANRLGPEGAGFLIAQERLGPGRIHHCMRWIGICERVFDTMCRHITHRKIDERQDARDAPDRAGVGRRGARRDRCVAPDGAARRVDDREEGLPGRARSGVRDQVLRRRRDDAR